jgi:hypothetical protein
VIAGGGVRAVLELGGVRDVLTKSIGTQNPINLVKATMDGLIRLRRPEEIAELRGLTVAQVLGVEKTNGPTETIAADGEDSPAAQPAGPVAAGDPPPPPVAEASSGAVPPPASDTPAEAPSETPAAEPPAAEQAAEVSAAPEEAPAAEAPAAEEKAPEGEVPAQEKPAEIPVEPTEEEAVKIAEQEIDTPVEGEES